MKNGLHFNAMVFKMAVLVTCFMLVMLYNKSKAADFSAVVEKAHHTAVAAR